MHISELVLYTTSSPYFWGSMGFTTATGMFVGAIIYSGDFNQAKKGIYSVLSYAGIILWVTFSRVIDSINNTIAPETVNFVKAYAGMATIFIVTFFWLLGIILGVKVNKLAQRKTAREKLNGV